MRLILSDSYLWRIPAVLIALTFHEFAHGKAAQMQGDPTAQYNGRLTLNPIAHIDPIGLLMLWIVGFGWAKPVPINPRYFNDYYRGIFKVALAGPLTNILLGFISAILLFQVGPRLPVLIPLLQNLVLLNVFLAVFNILPLPPLDGSKVLLALIPSSARSYYYSIEPYGPFILILLLIFNLIPIILVPVSLYIINIFYSITHIIF